MEICMKIKLLVSVGLLSSLFGVMHGSDFRIDTLIELIRNNNSDDVKRFLLDNKDVDLITWSSLRAGDSLLMIAVIYGDVDIIESLISAGVNNVNHKNIFGETALIFAVASEKYPIVGVLLKAGADPNIKNNKGKTALDIAKSQAMKDLLLLANQN